MTITTSNFFSKKLLDVWNVFVVIAVACVHGTAWTTSSSSKEILSFGQKLVIRHQSSTAPVLLLEVAVAAARMRRQQQAAAIHATRRWIIRRRQRHAQNVCQWNTCVIRHRRMQVLQLCVTVNRHYRLVGHFDTMYSFIGPWNSALLLENVAEFFGTELLLCDGI